MNFDFTEKEKVFFALIENTINNFPEAFSLKDKNPPEVDTTIRKAMAALGETGYLSIGLDTKDELAFNLLTLMGAMERLSRFSPSLFLSVEMSTRLFGRIIYAWGDAQQKGGLLDQVQKGAVIGAVALSEKAMNVENDPLETTGIAQEDGVVVNGRKRFVINAPIADVIAVVGTVNEQGAVFLIEQNTPGLKVHPPIETMGYKGAAISAVDIENCHIPKTSVISPMDTKTLLNTLRMWENQIIIGACIGMMKSSFESAKIHAKTHRSGGKPIIAYQEVGFKLSEMLTLLQTSRLYAYRAAWMADATPEEAGTFTLCAKVFCTESAETIAGGALQILSGTGYISGNPAEKAFRCSKLGQIIGTSTEIARVHIGDATLGWR